MIHNRDPISCSSGVCRLNSRDFVATNKMGSMLLSFISSNKAGDERECLAGGPGLKIGRQQLAGEVSKSMDVITLPLGGSES